MPALDRSLAVAARHAVNDKELVINAKQIALWALGLARQKFGAALEKQQEVMMHVADILTETFAMESVLLRSRKIVESGKVSIASEISTVFLRDAMARVEISARQVVGACRKPDATARLADLSGYEPIDAAAFRQKIAIRLLARERYALG